MTSRKKDMPKPHQKHRTRRQVDKPKPMQELSTRQDNRDKYFDAFTITALLAWGIYHSVVYFGHQAVPNPDFPDFFSVGARLWHFRLPGAYMRAPVVGLLQYPLSKIVPDQSALTAGWLLSAILHPCNVLLLYLVAKQIVGRAAVSVAIIAMLNPWALHNLIEPIAETPLLFFTLLSFYFMFRRSSWCYLFAAIAAMVRYEGTALIAAAFVMDMINRQGRRSRLRALGWAALASLPFGLWMLGTYLSWDPSRVHYLKLITDDDAKHVKGVPALVPHLKLLWEVTFAPLFRVIAKQGDQLPHTVSVISKVAAVITFLIGSVYGLYKRNWKILALLIFLVPYYLAHVSFPFLLKRFYSSVHWIVLLICLFGLQALWLGLSRWARAPRAVVIALQVLLSAGAVLSLRILLPHLSQLSRMSVDSRSIPWVTLALLLLLLGGGIVLYRTRGLAGRIAVAVIVFLMVVSNQFTLARVVGNGMTDYEFKLLADWYLAHARPGEKVLGTMTGTMHALLPQHRAAFGHITQIKGDDYQSFVRQCYEQGITYIAWDSRKGLYPNDAYYKGYRLGRIAPLGRPRSFDRFEYITTVGKPRSGRFINIFRLRPAPGPQPSR